MDGSMRERATRERASEDDRAIERAIVNRASSSSSREVERDDDGWTSGWWWMTREAFESSRRVVVRHRARSFIDTARVEAREGEMRGKDARARSRRRMRCERVKGWLGARASAALGALAWAASMATTASGQYDSTTTTLALERVWPESGLLYASTTVSLYGEGYGNALPPMGCRFGEIVTNKDSSASTATKVVCLTPKNVYAGFVAVGLAQATGRRYAPGSDDLIVDNGQHSFEFVTPWKVSSIQPEFVYQSGGDVIQLSGTHLRPGMECAFETSSTTVTSSFRFISSVLAMCETRAAGGLVGTVDLSLSSEQPVGGTEANVYYQTAPIIDGPVVSTTTAGSNVQVQASTSTPLSKVAESFSGTPTRIGCWFNGVWVAATDHNDRSLVCKAPMTYYGIVSLSVMDMYSQRMFPTNSSQSGWFTSFSFQRTEIIDVIVPSIGNAMRSTPADSSTLVDFYGLNLLAGSGSAAARICAALNPETTPILMSNQVQSKCDFPAIPTESVALAALSYGFHAASATSSSVSQPQFLIVSPPQVTSVVPGFLRASTVATFSGQNLVDPFRPTWCLYDGVALSAHIVSSALVRCLVPLYEQLPAGSSASAHDIALSVISDASKTAAGVSSMNWLPIANDLESITPNMGSISGGTRTVLKLEGGTIPTSSYYTPTCRFGTILTSAIHVPGGGVACSSPARGVQNVTVGIDTESSVEFQYVLDIGVTAVVPTNLPRDGGSLTVHLESAFPTTFGVVCVFVTSGGDKLKSTLALDASGQYKCKAPETGVGFATMAVVPSSTGTNNTAFIDEAAGQYFDLEIQTTTPGAEIFLLLTTNWVQAEEIIHVVTADGSLLGDSAADDDFSCAFSKPGGSVYLTTAHRVSGTTLKCPVPNLDSLISSTESGLDIVIGLCSAAEISAAVCSGFAGTRVRYEKRTAPSSLAPVNGTEAGGTTVVVVDSSTVLGFGANVPSCRFGSIYPVAGTSVTGSGKIDCVAPAHIGGTVPVSIPPLDLGLTVLAFEYIAISTSQTDVKETVGVDPYVAASLIDPTPMITEVSPWVAWSGTTVTLSGTHFPTGPDVRCKFGSTSVDAQVVSTAFIRCGDTVPTTTYDVEEQLVAVTTKAGETNPNVTTLQHYVVTKGGINAADADDGWQEGGNTVAITVDKWIPEGFTTCRFGTVSVQSRGGDGYGAVGKASITRLSQWWTDSTSSTKIECVSPARGPGDVQLGVSISGASTTSFVGTTFTYI